MSALPSIGFDTSAINALEDGGTESEPLMKALECGFDVRLPAMSADEILSTPTKNNPVRREALLVRCQRLLGSGQCIWPPHWILQLLISEHFRNTSLFDWTKISVRARVYERAIIERDFTDELCVRQRKEQFEVEERFEKIWKELRPKLDAILAEDPSKCPTNYHEAVAIAKLEGGALWGVGCELYRYVAGSTPTEGEIKAFMEVCPPFRGACYSLVMAWYDGALRLQDGKPSAGRNDLMMAAYLPYCGRFVTDDWPQEMRLREIATEARIDCEVLSYEKFNASFMVTV
jgi:hypothetical protein